MPCLYGFVAKLESWYTVKYGISKYDTPWHRIDRHNASRENPFGARIDGQGFVSLRFAKLRQACDVESQIKRVALSALPKIERYARPDRLSVPIQRVAGNNPSGEWLTHPGDEYACVRSFYELALLALCDRGDRSDATPSSRLAYERFYRRALEFHEGLTGYSELAVSPAEHDVLRAPERLASLQEFYQ